MNFGLLLFFLQFYQNKFHTKVVENLTIFKLIHILLVQNIWIQRLSADFSELQCPADTSALDLFLIFLPHWCFPPLGLTSGYLFMFRCRTFFGRQSDGSVVIILRQLYERRRLALCSTAPQKSLTASPPNGK